MEKDLGAMRGGREVAKGCLERRKSGRSQTLATELLN
jgi:hypothetical protein